MATGRSSKSSSRLKKSLKRREESRRQIARRNLRVETLEERQLLAVGPQLIGVQPNQGDLLDDGDIRNVSPQELTFHFNEGQVIDASTLDAIRITGSGSDFQFESATARTDFNTDGEVVVAFQAKGPGPGGNEISLLYSKRDMGGPASPTISVDGKTIFVELNTNRRNETTAGSLVNTLNAHAEAGELLEAVVVSGPTATDIATPSITYSPVDLRGANAATVTTDFNTGENLQVTFTAVDTGPAVNGFSIEVTKSIYSGANDPLIEVIDERTIHIDLNANPGAPTTAEQLVSAFNANAEARALVLAENPVGDPNTDIASPIINYSPLVLAGANDIDITPGYVGLGDSPREVVFRFSEPLPDDLYRVDIQGVGSAPLRNDLGFALGDQTDDETDNGQDFSLQFELDLGAQILGVVPQPVSRTSNDVLAQSTSQIEVYFNNDDLDPVSATNPSFYQLIHTGETADTSDDEVYKPIAVQYFPDSDRAMLTFRAPLHQLGSGAGTFRLRIGTDEDAPAPPVQLDLTATDVGSSFDSASDLNALLASQNFSGSVIVSSEISPQVYGLDTPGSNDEPGHRSIPENVETHLIQTADPDSGISTVFYNFRDDYGQDPSGNPLSNLISPEQEQRAREIFEIFGQELGVQFVETASQGITVVTGDLRALDPEIATGPGGVIGLSGPSPITNQPTVIMDNAEDWYDAFGASDDPLRPESWFETAMHEVGHQLGLGHTYELPPGTLMGSNPALAFTNAPEEIYPGDHDIVHGQHLYRTDGRDVDLYKFSLDESGLFSAETIAERQADSSLLDSVITLYRVQGGNWEILARNDDYFSEDSYVELDLEAGEYFVGVSAAGNEAYDPGVADTGFGGVSEGSYDLRLTFRPKADSAILDVDNRLDNEASPASQATTLDGNGDGLPGGVFNFWFRVDPTPIFVDKAAPTGGTGSLTSPFINIDDALAAARSGDVVRIVGNGGDDGDLATPEDNEPYEIGFDLLSRPLEDGSTMEIPRGVTVMVDRGAVMKLRRARIGAGSASPTVDRSAGALQVLGTPRLVDVAGQVVRDSDGNAVLGSVYFTSLNDEDLGGDSNTSVSTTPQAGEWGGLEFRNDLDRALGRFDWEQEGIFLNYVNQADIRYGGGTVVVASVPQTISPIQATDARPTITYNTISYSADAAISANPDSFRENSFHGPDYQDVPFTSDYTRVGPDVHGNRLIDNSLNGMFIRLQTPAGNQLEKLTVPGRWDDTDIVHIVSETLRIQGSPGGPVQTLVAPDAKLVTLQTQPGGTVPAGIVDYKLTFVDADGNEGPISDPTISVLVDNANPDTEETASIQLSDLPQAPAQYAGRRLYRSVKSEYVLVAELNATDRTYLDDGTAVGGLLQGSTLELNARLHGRLAIDPGTVVKLNGAGIETEFGAGFLAEGVDGGEIVFTSLQDNRYGAGGTFQTSDGGGLVPGNWTGIYVGHTSSASIDHAVLAYGGGIAEVPGSFAGFNALEIHQSTARVTNTLFEHNASGVGGQATANRDGRGTNAEALIFVRGSQPILMGNTMVGNSGPVISIDVNSLNHELLEDYGRSTGLAEPQDHIVDNQGPLIRENRMDDNDVNGMQVRGGTLTTQGVWDDTDIAHVILDDTIYVSDFHTYGGLRLESSGTESLVVKLQGANAGFTTTGQPLDITDRIGGILQIVGQPGFPVVLTSIQDDKVSAGFQPDGTPQSDTNNNGNPFEDGGTAVTVLPTGPEVNNGLVIDNDVDITIPGFFQVEPIAGGSIDILSNDAVTALGNTQLYTGADFIFNFLNYVDVGTGAAALLDATTVTVPPTLQINPLEDIVVSEGNFQGDAGQQINWHVESRFDDGVPIYYNTVTFTTDDPNQTLGDLQFANYLDEDVTVSFDILALTGTPGQADFRAFTMGDLDRVGFSHGGVYEAGTGLVNATYDGWAADVYPLLDTAVAASTATYSIPGDINLVNLPPLPDPDFGTIYGPRDVTTAFAWSVDPAANTATITSFLELLPRDPTLVEPNFAGDWRSIEMLENTHDRNVRVTTEQETGNATISGSNENAGEAQYVGELAPHEMAADDNRRLGFEIHGALNRPSDVDVYSFDGVAGTEVWLDIDRTTYSLNTVLELTDENGVVLARSDDSGAEAGDPSLLYHDPVAMDESEVNPLAKSSSNSQDLWTTNPRDAGFRVALPGPAGTTNTYHVRVRSSSEDLSDLDGGQTRGAYQLQIRLHETDEIAGSSIEMADIRYATNGIELSGLPNHSPLTGEAGEILDATGADDNNDLATADNLGNLLATDRGTLSVAGKIAAADDVDWYQFEVQYESLQSAGSVDPRHLSTVFDIDYADGFARANTNLWVFDDQGQLVLVGRDSNTPEDRPAGTDSSIDDLSRGSVGALDPFIGAVELPATGFATGQYFVAVSSNAQLPDQLDQFLTPTATNPFVRLEPINSVHRIAEDHVDSPDNFTTANRPEVPLLFGRDDEVSLFVPGGTEMRDGETVTVTNANGNSVTYEFDSDGNVTVGRIPVSYEFGFSAGDMGDALAAAITENPPPTLDLLDPLEPTAGAPSIFSTLLVASSGTGQIVLTEFVEVATLLNEVTTTDFLTSQLVVTPIYRFTDHQQEPTVRQAAGPGETKTTIYASRPGAIPFNLGDMTLFVSDYGFFGDDRTELLSVDPFTGQVETRIGAFGANVGDIAMHPGDALGDGVSGGGLFAFGIPEGAAPTDDTADDYWHIDPGTVTGPTTGADIGVFVDDGGIETYEEDPAAPGTEIDSDVGVLFTGMTFSNEEVDDTGVRGFAVGTRGDTLVDPATGDVYSTALGIPNPANILFEFDPDTGEALSGTAADRTGAGVLTAGGTQIVDRGALDTTVDAFPSGGANNTITGVDATTVDTLLGTLVHIEDGDIFDVDQDGDRVGDITFEFDTGPEFFITVDATTYLVDGNTFIVDGTQFEFDTGSVLIVTATNGSQLNDGDTITISDNAVTPSTMTFEFDADSNTSGNTPITFSNTSNQQSIISAIMAAINSVGNFGVTAQQLPGTNRITLLGESTVSGVATNAAGLNTGGTFPGVGAASIGIPVEETFTADEIGNAIATVIDGTQGQPFQAGAVGDRLNFMGALTASFAGVINPVFTAAGVQGTIGQFNLPVPFLVSDNSAEVAARVHQAVVGAGFDATVTGATVFLDPATPPDPQSTFVCISNGTPPLIGALGQQDCPLQSGGVAPGGSMNGLAFVGDQLYGVTDAGGLYRITDPTGFVFDPDSQFNVADYVDGSRELLSNVNDVVEVQPDPLTGELVETTSFQPIRFAGLVAGPQNTEDGLYENLLFGITDTGRIFAFDTFGNPQAMFANGTYYVDTGLAANGLALGTLDDNLWHISENRDIDPGHGITSSFDGSRIEADQTGNTSFYFGYEDPTVQPQFGEDAFAPAAATQGTYDFPGGAHGTLESNSFSLEGYSPADKPTLYFNYFLDTEQAEATDDATLDDLDQRMRDAFRVYIAGDDGHWKLVSTNNSDVDPLDDDARDEFDPFPRFDPITGQYIPEQPFDRAETFDSTGDWRQARVDLSPYSGQDNLRLRFDFSTAAGMSSGGRDFVLDLRTAGNELRAIPGFELRDGDMFTITGPETNPETELEEYVVVAGFEFNMGPTIVAPTGAAIDDGDLFALDGTIYEFDSNGNVGVTNSTPHVAIPFVGDETAGELVLAIQDVLLTSPPDPISLSGDLAASEPNETLDTAYDTGLDGTTQVFKGTGNIGDNFDLADNTIDVDMVQMHLDVGDTIEITTNTARLATQLDSYLRLFDANGNQLVANDNEDPTNAFSRDSKIEFTATKRGTYYVGISAAHNKTYNPTVPGSGVPDGVVSQGFYEFTISVTDPVGPQLAGNRLNLPNAGLIVPSGLPDSFVEGNGGTRPGLPNPFADLDSTLPDVPVLPVRVHAGMSSLDVADAMRTALADHLGNGNVAAVKARNEAVQIVDYGVEDAGPLGLSGPSDPSTAIPGSGLFGDLFGAFDASAELDGLTSAQYPGALGMQNNQFEGVYVDDIVIGFAARGEMVTAPDNAPALVANFLPNDNQPVGDIDEGSYQLEIRQATEYGLSDATPEPTLILYDGFDVNDRLADGVTLAVSSGDLYRDGQTFSVSDGAHQVTFEFDDQTVDDGVATGHEKITFDPSDSDAVMARRIRDAINNAAAQGELDAKATSSDGVIVGTASTSNLIHLYGDLTISVGLTVGGLGNVPADEGNDTPLDAIHTGIVGGARENFHATGSIGDNPNVDVFAADVDLYRVDLYAGEAIVVDIDATETGSSLDSLLRVFDAAGNPLTTMDDQGVEQAIESDDDLAPGEDLLLLPELVINVDSFVAFIAPEDGAYYIGVSGFGNDAYDPTVEGSGRTGSTGRYEISIGRPEITNGLELIEYSGKGDKNLFRDQGQVMVKSSHIRNSLEFGIKAEAAPRLAQGDAPQPGPVRNLSQINTSQLAPGVTITNNAIVNSGLGGISLSGDPGDLTGLGEQPASVPFARIINNTIVGRTTETGATVGDVGIEISSYVSPTVLNNILSNLETGITVDPTSTTTVLGGTLYHNNFANNVGIGLGDFPLIVDPAVELFVNPEGGNYYPAADSPAIDSSVDSLEDRPQMVQIQDPLGIDRSPILAPKYDASGQLRVDDPSMAPPPGMGESIFKDRGAIDRADFDGPTAKIISPLDNGADDLDPSDTLVNLLRASLDEFSIQLIDNFAGVNGIGIDGSTVTGDIVQVMQDNRLLEKGIDYSFRFDPTNNIIRLTPLAGVWEQESSYVITLSTDDRFVIQGVTGDLIAEGDSFDVVDEIGNTTTFEYDTGYVIHVPQTLAIQIPLSTDKLPSVSDGDLITVTQGTDVVTIEMDDNDVVTDGNEVVTFTADSSQGEIADAIVEQLALAGMGLTPTNVGDGLVHLGADGSQTLVVVSATMMQLGVEAGVNDGETFTIDDGSRVVTFEFSSDPRVSLGNVPVSFSYADTNDQIAEAIEVAVNDPAVGLGLGAQAMTDGRVQIGGELNHIVDVTDANLLLSGEPGATLAWGLRIPTSAGSFHDLVNDGETFTITSGVGVSVTFELDDNQDVTPGNTTIPFGPSTTTAQLANTIVSRVRNAGLGLFPFNAGNGIITLGGDPLYVMDVTNTSLAEVGLPGVPAATAIRFTPDESFTAELVAQATADAVNNRHLPGVTATAQGDQTVISGAVDVMGTNAQYISGAKDLAGNLLRGNQIDGETQFTVFIGAGMDYGDAPLPYPTLRADDGARHVILPGFSLGESVDINADGQPTDDANGDDQDGDDEDGVVFDSATPLVPNRAFNITVTTSGIGDGIDDVTSYGVVDAWIDYNGDGDWNDSNEKILSNVVLNASALVNDAITFRDLVVPANAIPGDTYARFRLSTQSNIGPAGETDAGEVEDYLVTIITNPWQNQPNRFDVNNSGAVSPVDALLLINYINANPGQPDLPVPKPANMPFLDVSGDGFITAVDVLEEINELNRLNTVPGGEGEAMSMPAHSTAARDHLSDVLSRDESWLDMVADVDQAASDSDAHDAFFNDLGV